MPINTNALKKFAQETRKKLMSQVEAKLEYVLTSDSAELREKANQLSKLQQEISSSSKEVIIDKVAYTWFNRLMALRFMDVNDYQPIGIRVITPKEGYTLPELLDEAKQGSIPDELPVKHQRIYDILDGKIPSSNSQNEAFKELLIGVCNHLNKVFPFLFEKINDYAELLLPDDLTSEFSIVQDIRDGMTIEDCEEVEVIGWLYQFYISEKKDEVFASKGKVKKEDIPAATQLFTPRWIVEYMVQNTVGKLWLQNNPGSSLKEHMPYYIESTSSGTEDYLKVDSVEEITLLDQACGSGHILVYGFELFTKIYEEQGYTPTEIPQLIVENNLYGFEIDERAAQLAGLALMMKARSYQRRIFKKDLKPNILSYQDLKLSDDEVIDSLNRISIKPSDELLKDLTNIQQATNLGSLIIPQSDISEVECVLVKVVQKQNETNDVFLKSNLNFLKESLSILKLLGMKYDCIVDNPPYMGAGKMNKILSDYAKKNYPSSKSDLMTCFMESGLSMLKKQGFLGMINLPSWLFLTSFEKLRNVIIQSKHIESLLHMGRGVFGVDWGSVAFVIRNEVSTCKGDFYKLHKRNFQHIYPNDIKEIFLKAKSENSIKINFDKYREESEISLIDELIDEDGIKIHFKIHQLEFKKIPSSPIGYWLNERMFQIFSDSPTIKEIAEPRAGLQTGDNEKFLRMWSEIDYNMLGIGLSKSVAIKTDYKWFPYNKGGAFKKWYGNREYVINWLKDGQDLKEDKLYKLSIGKCLPGNSKPHNSQYYFRESITWSFVSSGTFGVRYSPIGSVYDIAGSSVFPKPDEIKYLCSFLNSKLSFEMLKVLAPTINFQVGDIKRLPILIPNENDIESVNGLTNETIEIVKSEDESRESSWDFKKNELIRIKSQDLEESFDLYKQYWKNRFFHLHKNEEKLNRKFIEIYKLQDELTIDVPLEDITILKDEVSIENGKLLFHLEEVLIQFISYSVGCMFGRYSLDKEGLIIGNEGETLEDYLKKVGKSESEVSFLPDDDNIIPMLDDEWFEDDIVGRFYEFLKVTFGKENFDKNLAFVEEAIGKDIRKFFVKDFYNDHIKRYKKRPIYWMFSSPKGSFNVLVYMHRYTPDSLNQILNGYLKEYREKLNTRMEHLDHLIETGSSKEQTSAAKEKDKLKLVLLELQEYERDVLYPLATERIAIDLDDGVLVNYNKFGKAIKEVKGLNDKKTKDKVRKFDWINTEEIR